MKSILNPEFRYVRSEKTDIRKLFARVRKQMADAAKERTAKVEPLRKKSA